MPTAINRASRLAFLVVLLLDIVPVGASEAGVPVKPKNSAEATVMAFLDAAFNQRKFDKAFAKYVGPEYRQHNPTVADGKQAVIDALRRWLPATPALHYEFKHVYSDGDHVIVHSLVTVSADDRGKAVIDIFRLEHGKVVEHWDVAQPVPEKSANDNTMF